jgi:hypothetical protein
VLVSVAGESLTVMSSDNALHTLPFEPLTDKDMILQARYHLWTRAHEYRRMFVCRRCKEPMETETQANDEDQTWELLTVCSCRALYGKIPLSALQSLMPIS